MTVRSLMQAANIRSQSITKYDVWRVDSKLWQAVKEGQRRGGEDEHKGKGQGSHHTATGLVGPRSVGFSSEAHPAKGTPLKLSCF